jgi:hypothetical protein
MTNRLNRLAPFTGVLFAALALVGFFAGPSTPNSDASGAAVIAYYVKHRSAQKATDIVLTLAFVLFVFFAGSLRAYLRRTPRAEPLSTLALAGAAMTATGFMLFTGIEFSLADIPTKLTPSAAQALNLLDNDFFFPTIAGMCVFGIASGLAITRAAPLPKWLGSVAIVIGVVSLTPAFLPAIVALLIWTVATSTLIYLRTGPDSQAPAAQTANAVGALSN